MVKGLDVVQGVPVSQRLARNGMWLRGKGDFTAFKSAIAFT